MSKRNDYNYSSVMQPGSQVRRAASPAPKGDRAQGDFHPVPDAFEVLDADVGEAHRWLMMLVLMGAIIAGRIAVGVPALARSLMT